MPFMEAQVYETDYIEIDGPHGTEIIPCDVVNFQPCTCGFSITPTYSAHAHSKLCACMRTDPRIIPSPLRDYCENSVMWTIERKRGWIGRMSAPGYTDCTEWIWGDSETQVRAELKRMYGDEDDDCQYLHDRYPINSDE